MAQLRAAVLDYLVSIILERFLAHVFLLFLQLLHLFNIALNIILLFVARNVSKLKKEKAQRLFCDE